MDKEFAEEFGLELTEGKVEELGKQIASLAHKFKEGKDDVMTMTDEMITNGTMPDPKMVRMLETEEADMIVHLIAKKMGIQWTKENGYGEMRMKQNYPESTDMVMNLLGKRKVNEGHGKSVCPKCDGEGCDHCDGKGYHINEMPNRRYMEKINTLLKDYHGKFKWRDEVLYVTKEIEKDVRDIISKDKGHSYMVKVSKNPLREGWKKGKYTIKDNKGKILGTYNSGGKAQKAMDDLMQKGDYDKLEVSIVEEVEIEEAKKPTRDAGMECMECGKKFRAKLSTLQYGKTKCPKCKSTDLDFAFGESVKKEVEEGIDVKKASMKDVIKDFQSSDAPQFKGKSDKKKKEMAIAAKLSREENEDDDPVGKPKKKSKKDVINLKPTAESNMKKLKDIMTNMKEKRSNDVEEAVNLKKLKKEYEKNEDKNYHTENYLLLAKAFGTPAEVKKVQEIMKRNEKQGSTSKADSDWMYKNINPYYDKIRNEEVEVAESDGYEVDLAAKKIQHKWKRMSKAEKVRFLDKMDVLAGKTKVSDSDLEDILSDYGLYMEATGDKEAYQKFFQSALKKFGVKSPAELKGEKKKEFFDYVDKNWTGDHEEQTKKEEIMTKKSLKDAVSGMKEKKSKVTEAITIGGIEVGEQEFDKGARIDQVAPNLGMTYKDYQAKFETNGLEGPYQIDGGAYFWDKMASKWFSVETEDYVDDERNAELNFRYTKGGSGGGGMLYQRSYNN